MKDFKDVQVLKLKMVKEVTVSYDTKEAVGSPELVYKLLTNEYFDLANSPEEQFCLVCLNTKNVPVGIHMVSHGSKTGSIVEVSDVFKRALLNNATSIIVAHNHPSGNTQPSPSDIEITNRLFECGKLLGTPLLDHIIIGDGKYLSLKKEGYINN